MLFRVRLALCRGLWMQTPLGIRLPGPVSVAMLGEMGISGTRKAAPSLSWHFASHRGLDRVAYLRGGEVL